MKRLFAFALLLSTGPLFAEKLNPAGGDIFDPAKIAECIKREPSLLDASDLDTLLGRCIEEGTVLISADVTAKDFEKNPRPAK